MSELDRKARIREYKETARPAGVYRVRNTARGQSLIGSSSNLPGILNRHRFELKGRSHRNRDLQMDWNELGPDAFIFEVLDELKPKKDPDYDPSEDLEILLSMWADKLVDAGESLYGQTGK